jgi:rsbT antagonist protein RsbS
MNVSILKLKDTLIVSVQSELKDSDVEKLQYEVLKKIFKTDVKYLIIDVSPLYLMDSFIARSIIKIAKAAKYMGVYTVISGISVEITLTLLNMGFDWGKIETALNLEHGIEKCRKKQKTL